MIWHYPDDRQRRRRRDEKDYSSKRLLSKRDFTWRWKRCNHLYPTIFIIDFDHTLAVFDNEHEITSVYTRPFMVEFLEYLKKINRNNILILWTRGQRVYINRCVLLLGIGNYFDHILSRDECKISFKKYKCYKSFRFIIDYFPKYTNMRSFLIDNLAYRNGGGCKEKEEEDDYVNYYFKLISVKPFTIEDVKNKDGTRTDSTLLNLMLYLNTNFFKQDDIKRNKIYKVITADKKGTLFLDERLDASDCQVFVKSWCAKM